MSELKKQIRISQVLKDLENGVTRAEMATKYDISPREIKVLFDHPKLKGKKAKKIFKPSFDLVDDTMENQVAEQTVDNTEYNYDIQQNTNFK